MRLGAVGRRRSLSQRSATSNSIAFPLVGGKAATIFDRSGTVIDAQYRGTPAPPTSDSLRPYRNRRRSLTDLWKPAAVDGLDQFILWLIGFPEGIIFGISPLALPFCAATPMRPTGERNFRPRLVIDWLICSRGSFLRWYAAAFALQARHAHTWGGCVRARSPLARRSVENAASQGLVRTSPKFAERTQKGTSFSPGNSSGLRFRQAEITLPGSCSMDVC